MAVVRIGPCAVVAALVLAACSGGGDSDVASSTTTLPAAPASPSSTAPPTTGAADPFAVPEVIDAAYVNRVLAALYKVDGDVTREILRTRDVTTDALRLLGAVFGEPQLTTELQALPAFLQQDPSQFKNPPGDRRVNVESLPTTSPTCIAAVTEMSLADVVEEPSALAPDERYLIVLVPKDRTARGSSLNPTPWIIVNGEIVKRGAAREVGLCE